MKTTTAYRELLAYAQSAVNRFPDGDDTRLALSVAARALTLRHPDAASIAQPAAVASVLSVALRRPFGQRRARAALASARDYLSSVAHPARPPAVAVAERMVAAIFADLRLIPFRRRALARRGAAVIGWTAVAEAARFDGRVIVSARWMAQQLGVVLETGNRVIADLVDAGVLTNERKLRDKRTRSFKLRAVLGDENAVLLTILAETVEQVATGAECAPGSVADVLRTATSPVWTHDAADVPLRSGAWTTALREAASPLVADAVRQYRAATGGGDAYSRAAVALRGRLSVAAFGGASKNTRRAALDWLAQRDDRSYGVWLAELAEATGAGAAAAERRDAAARNRRASRKAADAATGRRSWRTPEEVAGEVLSRLAGGLPTDRDGAQTWLGRVAAGWAEVDGRLTGAQDAAVRDVVQRVLVRRADLDESKARLAVERIMGAPPMAALGVAA